MSTNFESVQDEMLGSAKELIKHIESGDDIKAIQTIDHLNILKDMDLYREVGKLTRKVYDTLAKLADDEKIAGMSEEDVSSATTKLENVIKMTQEAADKTISSIEVCQGKIKDMDGVLDKLDSNESKAIKKDLSGVNSELSVMLMAQTYQDLTGQTIKKIIHLINEIQDGLVDLIYLAKDMKGDKTEAEEFGTDTVEEQEDVDKLLSDLGF